MLLWRLRHVSERVYVCGWRCWWACWRGLAAVVLKTAVHWQQDRLANWP
ncbi:MAG: hypothetical protein WKG07_41165 [Hymenobacter sp.]